jgi:peptide/nickel transport system substrate-binding protein
MRGTRAYRPLVGALGMLLVLGLACKAPSESPQAARGDAAQPRYGGAIRFLTGTENRAGWDPQGPETTQAIQGPTLSNIFNALVSYPAEADQQNEPLPRGELAERWETPDPLTYVFYLRKGVKFHNKPPVNGRELDADDVKYSFDRFLKSAGRYRWAYDSIADVEVIDRYTVRIRLKEPDAAFLSHMAGWPVWIAPRGVAGPPRTPGWVLDDEFREPDQIIGTGPFMFERHERDVRLSLRRNPDYFKPGLPYADRWEYLMVGDPSTRMAMMTAGQAEYFVIPEGSAASFMASNSRMSFSQDAPASFQGLSWRSDKPPFNNVNVRRAMAMAIDQQAMMSTYAGSRANPYYGGLSKTHFPEWFTSPEQLSTGSTIRPRRSGYSPRRGIRTASPACSASVTAV